MTEDAYTWGMALSLVNHKLEGALYSHQTGKKRLKQKPKYYKKKKKAKAKMCKTKRR